MKKKFIDSGRIVGTHGIKGELRIDPWCDNPQFLCDFNRYYLDCDGKTFIDVKSRPHKNIVLCKAKGIDTVEDADKMRGKTIYISRDEITLEEGVHFVQDLIGLEIRDADNNKVYGKLTDVMRTGSNDVYEVTAENKKVYLVPAIEDVIRDINCDDGYMLICPLKGIFDDEN